MVDDGIQPPVELSCKDRNIMAATFIRFLHKNIGEFEKYTQLNLLKCVDELFDSLYSMDFRRLGNISGQGELFPARAQADSLQETSS